MQPMTTLQTKNAAKDALAVVGSVPTTGTVFFVHSGTGSNSNSGKSFAKPFASIDYAVGKCTADKGDVIVAMPGHVETVSAANGLDLDVSGIRLVCLGEGGSRASVNLTNTASTIRVNANNVTVQGLLVTGGIDAVVLCIDVNGKTDVTFRDLTYRDVTGQCTVFFKAANNSDRLTIEGVKYIGDSAAGTNAAFQFDGCDDLTFKTFDIVGNFANSAIEFVTTASARVRIEGDRSFIWNQNSSDMCIKDTITGSTGNIGGDIRFRLTDNAANITEAITGATFTLFDNIWVANNVNEKAMLINWTASTDA